MRKVLVLIGVSIFLALFSFSSASAGELNIHDGYALNWQDAHPVDVRYHEGFVYVQLENNPIGDVCRFGERWDFRFDGTTAGGRALYAQLNHDLWHADTINIGVMKVHMPRSNCVNGNIADMSKLLWESSSVTL